MDASQIARVTIILSDYVDHTNQPVSDDDRKSLNERIDMLFSSFSGKDDEYRKVAEDAEPVILQDLTDDDLDDLMPGTSKDSIKPSKSLSILPKGFFGSKKLNTDALDRLKVPMFAALSLPVVGLALSNSPLAAVGMGLQGTALLLQLMGAARGARTGSMLNKLRQAKVVQTVATWLKGGRLAIMNALRASKFGVYLKNSRVLLMVTGILKSIGETPGAYVKAIEGIVTGAQRLGAAFAGLPKVWFDDFMFKLKYLGGKGPDVYRAVIEAIKKGAFPAIKAIQGSRIAIAFQKSLQTSKLAIQSSPSMQLAAKYGQRLKGVMSAAKYRQLMTAFKASKIGQASSALASGAKTGLKWTGKGLGKAFFPIDVAVTGWLISSADDHRDSEIKNLAKELLSTVNVSDIEKIKAAMKQLDEQAVLTGKSGTEISKKYDTDYDTGGWQMAWDLLINSATDIGTLNADTSKGKAAYARIKGALEADYLAAKSREDGDITLENVRKQLALHPDDRTLTNRDIGTLIAASRSSGPGSKGPALDRRFVEEATTNPDILLMNKAMLDEEALRYLEVMRMSQTLTGHVVTDSGDAFKRTGNNTLQQELGFVDNFAMDIEDQNYGKFTDRYALRFEKLEESAADDMFSLQNVIADESRLDILKTIAGDSTTSKDLKGNINKLFHHIEQAHGLGEKSEEARNAWAETYNELLDDIGSAIDGETLNDQVAKVNKSRELDAVKYVQAHAKAWKHFDRKLINYIATPNLNATIASIGWRERIAHANDIWKPIAAKIDKDINDTGYTNVDGKVGHLWIGFKYKSHSARMNHRLKKVKNARGEMEKWFADKAANHLKTKGDGGTGNLSSLFKSGTFSLYDSYHSENEKAQDEQNIENLITLMGGLENINPTRIQNMINSIEELEKTNTLRSQVTDQIPGLIERLSNEPPPTSTSSEAPVDSPVLKKLKEMDAAGIIDLKIYDKTTGNDEHWNGTTSQSNILPDVNADGYVTEEGHSTAQNASGDTKLSYFNKSQTKAIANWNQANGWIKALSNRIKQGNTEKNTKIQDFIIRAQAWMDNSANFDVDSASARGNVFIKVPETTQPDK